MGFKGSEIDPYAAQVAPRMPPRRPRTRHAHLEVEVAGRASGVNRVAFLQSAGFTITPPRRDAIRNAAHAEAPSMTTMFSSGDSDGPSPPKFPRAEWGASRPPRAAHAMVRT